MRWTFTISGSMRPLHAERQATAIIIAFHCAETQCKADVCPGRTRNGGRRRTPFPGTTTAGHPIPSPENASQTGRRDPWLTSPSVIVVIQGAGRYLHPCYESRGVEARCVGQAQKTRGIRGMLAFFVRTVVLPDTGIYPTKTIRDPVCSGALTPRTCLKPEPEPPETGNAADR